MNQIEIHRLFSQKKKEVCNDPAKDLSNWTRVQKLFLLKMAIYNIIG